MPGRQLLAAVALSCGLAAQSQPLPPQGLPATSVEELARSLDAAEGHPSHVWRDTLPTNSDGTVNAYIEIARGDRRKWELDMRANARAIDRVMPESIGGYPVNYGFVPQTVSYDGDPFDALVLGPPMQGGEIVRGAIVGIMHMEDEKGLDPKVVLAVADAAGRPLHALSTADRQRIGDYFKRYKQHESGRFSKVPGWGTAAEGRAFVTTTHAFFLKCRQPADGPCTVAE